MTVRSIHSLALVLTGALGLFASRANAQQTTDGQIHVHIEVSGNGPAQPVVVTTSQPATAVVVQPTPVAEPVVAAVAPPPPAEITPPPAPAYIAPPPAAPVVAPPPAYVAPPPPAAVVLQPPPATYAVVSSGEARASWRERRREAREMRRAERRGFLAQRHEAHVGGDGTVVADATPAAQPTVAGHWELRQRRHRAIYVFVAD